MAPDVGADDLLRRVGVAGNFPSFWECVPSRLMRASNVWLCASRKRDATLVIPNPAMRWMPNALGVNQFIEQHKKNLRWTFHFST